MLCVVPPNRTLMFHRDERQILIKDLYWKLWSRQEMTIQLLIMIVEWEKNCLQIVLGTAFLNNTAQEIAY